MPYARLCASSKVATQSGKNSKRGWTLEIIDPEAKFHDPMMGWSGAENTCHEMSLSFGTLEEAERYCEVHHISPIIIEAHASCSPPKSYTDNFTKGFRY